MKYDIYNKNYIYDECDSNQSYSFGKNDNSNQNNNESNDELDSNKNKDNHNYDCSNNELDDSNDESSDNDNILDSSGNDLSNKESSNNNNNSNDSNNNFDDDKNNKKWKRIKVDNICSEVEGVFSKSELKKFGEEYDVYIKDIRCENKEEILKDENNADYKWKSTIGHAIIKFVKRRPKMATQQVRYVTHDEFKVFAENLNKTIANSIGALSKRIDSMEDNFKKEITHMEQRLEKKIDQKIAEVKADVAEIKSDMVEVKQDIALIKKCPTIKKELSELED